MPSQREESQNEDEDDIEDYDADYLTNSSTRLIPEIPSDVVRGQMGEDVTAEYLIHRVVPKQRKKKGRLRTLDTDLSEKFEISKASYFDLADLEIVDANEDLSQEVI